MSHISSLKLHNFRCYARERLEGLGAGLVVLSGANGAGKTNVLEAVSLLAPGRGLRGAKVTEIQRLGVSPPSSLADGGEAWAVAAQVETRHGPVRIGTGLDPQTEKRTVRINGETARGQSALAAYLACVWLTPQMDRLFLDSAGHRRRFLDRLVFAFDPGHSGRLTRYENAMAQRSKLLREGKGDPAWLKALESQMAETGTAIAAARLDFTARLGRACKTFSAGKNQNHFPQASLALAGSLEELLKGAPALEVEEIFAYQLRESRARDALTGGAARGPHKTDLLAAYAEKNNMPAAQCSTGEQKALLIGLILAHAGLIAAERGAPPVLLLDEVAAHLDEDRRRALYGLLLHLGGQVWLTGTDRTLFAAVEGKAQFFAMENGSILPDEQPAAAPRKVPIYKSRID